MELIYILTYDCNLRCDYCDVWKRKETMSTEVIQDSFTLLRDIPVSIHKVKFFGGEPLLCKKNIQDIIISFPKKHSPQFFITTNALLVDDVFMSFCRENRAFVTFSIDGDRDTTEKKRTPLSGVLPFDVLLKNTQKYAQNIRVNQVIHPDTVSKCFDNFCFLYSLGVRAFNFLPAYYREWSTESLKILSQEFKKILLFLERNQFYCVNGENFSETSFFNLGIVIDTDGRIYGTNLILSWVFEEYKIDLCVGTVKEGIKKDFFSSDFQEKYIQAIQKCLIKKYPKSVLQSVYYVDKILTRFVNEILIHE